MLSTAEKRLPSSLSGLLVATVPLVGVALALLLRSRFRSRFRSRDHIDSSVILGLVLGLVGVGALVGFDVGRSSLGAVGLVALVVVGYASGPVIIDRALSDLPALGVVAASFVLCALGYLPFAVVQRPRFVPGTSVLESVAVLGVVCTAVGFVLFFALIAEIGPLRATIITYVNPVVALTLGVVFLHESFTVGMAVGFPLILAGCVVATRRRRVGPDASPPVARPPHPRERRVRRAPESLRPPSTQPG